jgi:hypothetical protein
MKQMVLGICGCVLIIYSVYINQNFADSAIRESELSMALSHGINQTLEMHKEETFESEDAMEEYFIKLLKSQITSDGTLKVKIISSSCQYGILDVEVSEYFQTSDQKERKISVRKCGIIDEELS